ncbi:MAG: hypothetical protein QOC95_466, partial [Thermoleophilaceae bacterium]|nr:hypothetical protein [Thermoleophilaceae bacterium]
MSPDTRPDARFLNPWHSAGRFGRAVGGDRDVRDR